jgi:hypothetical protein
MSRFLRTVAAMAAIGLALGVVAVVALVAWGSDPLAQAVLTIDGNQVTLGQVHGSVALAAALTLVVVMVLVLVVPFAVVLPLVATGLALALALVAVAGTAALVLSPLFLIGWGVWRLARSPRTGSAAS